MSQNETRKPLDDNLTNDERAELFGRLIDEVEDYLQEKGITTADIPNDDREGDKGEAIIYGADYDYLADRFAVVLGIGRYVVNSDSPHSHDADESDESDGEKRKCLTEAEMKRKENIYS